MSAKVVLVTGCSEGGIGYHLCQEFAERGCRVYATARRIEKMKGLQSNSRIELLALDVTSDDGVKCVVETIIAKEGRIDILINNAGLGCFGPILEVPLDQVKDIYDTNVFSILRVSRVVVPHMASRKSGLILNIGSIAGEIPTPWSGIYASSKAAVHAITDVLSMECKPFDINVMLVSPGGVKSNIASNSAPRFTLIPDTLYRPYLDNIVKRMWTSQIPSSISAEMFAKRVVGKALISPPPSYITLGSNAITFQVLKWLPRTWIHSYLWSTFGTLKKTQ